MTPFTKDPPPQLAVDPVKKVNWIPQYDKAGYYTMTWPSRYVPLNETYFPTKETCEFLIAIFENEFGRAKLDYINDTIPGQPFASTLPTPVLIFSFSVNNATAVKQVFIRAGFLANIWTLETEHPEQAYGRAALLIKQAMKDQGVL